MADFVDNMSEARKYLHMAAKQDQDRLYTQAIDNYLNGISYLMKQIEATPNEAKQLKEKITVYIERAEALKIEVRKSYVVKEVKQRIIEEDSVGHSYENIFKGVLDETVTFAEIEEPYLELVHQMNNLVRFCEMLVINAPRLKAIKLTTKSTSNKTAIDELARSLGKRSIILRPYFAEIHDREIKFDNGYIVKMGRGLDIYKKVDHFSIGSFDFNLRPCRSCKIEIIKRQK